MNRSQKIYYVLPMIALALLMIAPLSFTAFAQSELGGEGERRGTTPRDTEVDDDAKKRTPFDDDNADIGDELDDELDDEDSDIEDTYRDDRERERSDDEEPQWRDEEEEDWHEEEDWDEEDRWCDEENESFDVLDRIERAREIAAIGESKGTAAAFAIELLYERMEPDEVGQALRKMLETIDDPGVRRVIRLHLAVVYGEIDQRDEMLNQLIELCR